VAVLVMLLLATLFVGVSLAQQGTEEWSFNAGGEVQSSPVVADGKVYFTSGSTLYAVDADTGTEVNSKNVGSSLDGISPVVQNGNVYVGSNDGMYAYDLSLNQKWSETDYEVTTTTDGVK